MPNNDSRNISSNRILSRLSGEDYELIRPYLEAVDLPLRKSLETRNKKIEHVYFFESGFASVVANGSSNSSIEVGIIGREGMSGLAVIMETDRSPHDTYMQNAGNGQRITAANLHKVQAGSATIRRAFLHYGHAFVIQTAYTALANGRSKMEDRLARWLLMAHDRLDGDEVRLTHEFLSLMLGVRRPGVTVALNLLEKDGLIRSARGVISIIDRKGLEENSNGAYGVPEAEFQRLFS